MNEDSLFGLSLSAREQTIMRKDILDGKFGAPGDVFLTTRALSEVRQISLVSAHSVLTGLCASGYIKLVGKRYYLSHEKLLAEHQENKNIIGLLLPQLNNEFYASLAEAVVDVADKNGYGVVMVTTSYEDKKETRALKLMMDYKVSGIISCIPTDAENGAAYLGSSLPCVSLAHSINNSKISSVQVNSFSISQKVAQNLIEEGYRHFMYIGTRKIPLENDIRFIAFNMELKKQGLSLKKEDILQLSSHSKTDEELLSGHLLGADGPLGVFCYHDLLAAAVYRVCSKINKCIPDEVGVIGFDDLSIATSLYPPLTTVQYRVTTMADMAVNLLLAKIKSPDAPYDNYYIEPNLVIRKSAALSGKKQNI